MALICVTQSVTCSRIRSHAVERHEGALTLYYLVPHDHRGQLVDAHLEAVSTLERSFLWGNKSFFDAVEEGKFLTIKLPLTEITRPQLQHYKVLFQNRGGTSNG